MLVVVAVFEIAAALLLGLGVRYRVGNRPLSDMFLGGAVSLAILPGLAFLAFFLNRVPPP